MEVAEEQIGFAPQARSEQGALVIATDRGGLALGALEGGLGALSEVAQYTRLARRSPASSRSLAACWRAEGSLGRARPCRVRAGRGRCGRAIAPAELVRRRHRAGLHAR